FFNLATSRKKIVRLLAVKFRKGHPKQYRKRHKRKNDRQLPSRCLLNILSAAYFTHLTRTVLHLVFKEERIELASKTDPKRRFKKEKDKTDQTNNTSDYAVGIHQHHKHKHRSREDQTDDPCKLLLTRTRIFRRLPSDDKPSEDQGGGIPGANKDPNKK